MTEDSGFNLDERLNCSDEACIGLVGSSGKCKVCGLPYVGDEPLPGTSPSSTDDDPKPVTTDVEPQIVADDDDNPDPSDPNDRVCCPDEACIGIIGENNTCGTCGKHG